jgi:hypothetical protein
MNSRNPTTVASSATLPSVAWLSVLLCAASLALPGTALAGGNITKIEPNSAQAVLVNGKATVRFTVSGSAEESDSCGLWVNYGDGDSPDTRIVSKSDGLFPRTFEHTFTKPGGFSVKAKGQRVKQTFGCSGEVETFIQVAAAAPAAGASSAAAAVPACPDGWQLAPKSYNKSTGAFACSAKPPAAKLACGAGLAYYEKDGLIGCRKSK